MKMFTKIFFVFALVLTSLVGFAQSPAVLDADNGLQGIKFGSSLREDARFTLQEKQENIRLYTKDGESDQIHYLTSNDELFMIAITVTDKEQAIMLMRALQSRYGEPQREDENKLEFCWHGEHVLMTLTVANGECIVRIYSIDVINQQKEIAESQRS